MHPITADTGGGQVVVHYNMPITHYGVRGVFDDDKGRRCTVQIAQAYITFGREPEAEANARLIAAAPDMLAALKEAFEYSPFHAADCEGTTECDEEAIFDQTKGCTCYLSRMRAAIAKATGAA